MAYATVNDLSRLLPEKIKIGDQNIGTPVPGNSVTGRSNISPAESEYYIEYATQHVDSKLRNMYVTPLRRIKEYETDIMADIHHGTTVTVTVRDSGAFIRGNMVRLQAPSYMETATVFDVPTLTTIRLVSVQYDYSVLDGLISTVKYPDPIPTITARFALSFIIDRLWVSEQSPDISSYGATQRNLAINNIDDILTGTIVLMGQDYTGRRFVRGQLMDAYGSPYEKIQKGEDKES
jgi:hypothetical protein